MIAGPTAPRRSCYKPLVADAALLVLTVLWGSTFLLVKLALQGTSPAAFLALRFGTAAAALGVAWAVRRDRVTPDLFRRGLLLGLAMLAGFALQTWGLERTTPARSGFLTGLAVLFVPFITRFLKGRKIAASSWAGVLLAVAGLAVLTRPFDGGVAETIRLGDALTAGCAVAFALQIVYTSEWAPRHPLVPLVFLQVAVTFLGSVALLPLEPLRLASSPRLAGTVAFTGLVMTAMAFFVQNWGQRHTTAVRAALIFSLEPVAAALFSHFVGGEPLAAADWGGGGLIVAGVITGEVGGDFEGSRATCQSPCPDVPRSTDGDVTRDRS